MQIDGDDQADARAERLKKDDAKSFIRLLSSELLGRTTISGKFVNVSDGGHFENLGLYEMVRRRCTRIFVVDASQDPDFEFEDLENAIRKVRTDLGYTIDFGDELPTPKDGLSRTHIATATIDYGDNLVGRIIYVKPCLTGDEPPDVLRYAARSIASGRPFPHHSTGDQFFDEIQFESYRALGFHSVDSANLPIWQSFGYFPQGQLEGTGVDSPEDFPSGAVAAVPGGFAQKIVELATSTDNVGDLVSNIGKWLAAVATLLAAPTVVEQLTPSNNNVVMVLPEHRTSFVGPESTIESVFLLPGSQDRISLPLFKPAKGCTGGVSQCTDGVEPSALGQELVKRVVETLQQCDADGELKVRVIGFSSTSDFSEGGKPAPNSRRSAVKNGQLADYRACQVMKLIAPEAGKERFEPGYWSEELSSASSCQDVATAAHSDAGLAKLDSERVPDASKDTYDATLGAMNRRVDLVITNSVSGCDIPNVVRSLQKGYASPGERVKDLAVKVAL